MSIKSPFKYIAYTRKSTIGEDRQVLSLEDQERDLVRLEQTEHLNVIARYTGKERGESQSAHKRGRPIFSNIMLQIEDGKANALLVWHPNRLARNAFDGGWIITAMDEGKLLEVKTANGTYRNTSNDKFMLALEFGMAKKSSDDNGDAVKRGTKTKLNMGWYPSRAPLGYLNSKIAGKGQNYIYNDPERPRPLTRRFAYTGIMECGHCGAAITAEEKIKRYKNGTTQHFIYYHCTKRIDPKCPEKTVELKELTKQADLIIRGLTISDAFRDWAIKYLHEVRSGEADAHEQVVSSKQKRVLEITKQVDALLLRYTSPANIAGDLISDTEYKNAKNTLLSEKVADRK